MTNAQFYPGPMNGDRIEFEREHASTPPEERPDWPLPSFDARDWAKAFVKIAKGHGQRYCSPCKVEYTRQRMKSPFEAFKEKARQLAMYEKRSGRLVPLPCEKCGNQKVEMHHADYRFPLRVTWLCRPCHRAAHSEINVALGVKQAVKRETLGDDNASRTRWGNDEGAQDGEAGQQGRPSSQTSERQARPVRTHR